MRRSFSPVLALFLIGCDLGSLIPDTVSEEAPTERDDPQAPAGEDTRPEDAIPDEIDCCNLSVHVPASVVAGEQVDVAVSLRDADGTDQLEGATISLSVVGPDGALGAEGTSFQPMTAGDYTVTVSVELMGVSFQEAAELRVDVGAAEALRVTLSDSSVDPGEQVSVFLEGWDVGGNAVEALDAVLSVSPEGCADIDGLSLTALVDGGCTVSASVGDLVEAASFLIDGNGPIIQLDPPGRAAFVDGSRVSVSGGAWDAASGVAALTVNGVPVSDPGAFSSELTLTPGAHTVTIEAIDNDGNSSDLVAGLIAGHIAPDGTPLRSLQLSRSAEAIGELGALVSQQVSADDIADAVLTGEPFYDSTDGCSGMTITATDASVGAVSGAVTPVEGALEVSVVVTDLAIDLEAEAWAEVRGQCHSTVTTDQLTVAETEVVVQVSLSAEDGTVVVEVVQSGALMSGLDEGMAADLGIDVAALIEEAMVAAVEAAVPAALSDVFADLALSESFEMLGAAIALEASVSDVSVSPDGVSMSLSGTATCDAPVLEAPGSLASASSAATLSGDGAAISVDLLNRLLDQGWRSGGLRQHIPHEQLGLDSAVIGLLFPGAETLSLSLDPQLPPVALDVGAGQPLSLSMLELQVEAWGEVAGEAVLLGRVALHLSGTATPAIRRGMLSLTLDIDEMVADSMDPSADGVAAAEGLEDMLGLFAGSLGSELLGDVSLALPEALGAPTAAETDGAGWLILSE